MHFQLRNTSGLAHHEPSKAFLGYTLFAPMYGTDVWIVDMEGRVVHRWEMPLSPGCDGELLPNGNLLWAGKVIPGPLQDFGGSGGAINGGGLGG